METFLVILFSLGFILMGYLLLKVRLVDSKSATLFNTFYPVIELGGKRITSINSYVLMVNPTERDVHVFFLPEDPENFFIDRQDLGSMPNVGEIFLNIFFIGAGSATIIMGALAILIVLVVHLFVL